MSFRLKKLETARISYSLFKAGNNILTGNGSHDSTESLRCMTKNLQNVLLQKAAAHYQIGRALSNTSYVIPMFSSIISSRLAFHSYVFASNVSSPSIKHLCNVLSGSNDDKDNRSTSNKLPSPQKLQHVHDVLLDNLPKIFVQPPNVSIYHKNLVFENRIRNLTTVGLSSYICQIYLMKFIAHVKFSCVKFHILNISKCQDEGSIKVRWRIKGITTFQALIHFYKTKKWGVSPGDLSNWYDGYSTFYVNADGKVTKHVVDNVMKDESPADDKSPLGLAKLALIIGVVTESDKQLG